MVFYFSGTGNTLWAARMLASATNERLVPIADVRQNESFTLDDGERIGFCFPIHGWKPPRIVRKFIAQLNIDNATGHYCYALCTCGDSVGKAMEILNDDLAQHNLRTESVFSITMPETYVALPFMYTDKPEREQKKLRTATKQMKNITESVIERQSGLSETVTGPVPWVLSHIIGTVFNRFLITDKPFKVNPTRCTKCGTCAQVCPVGNIDGGRSHKPTWLHNGTCTSCLSCYHHCPRHAIEYGPLTKNRGQYYFKNNKND